MKVKKITKVTKLKGPDATSKPAGIFIPWSIGQKVYALSCEDSRWEVVSGEVEAIAIEGVRPQDTVVVVEGYQFPTDSIFITVDECLVALRIRLSGDKQKD